MQGGSISVSRPLALEPVLEREAWAFVADLGVCGLGYEALSHCLKMVSQALVCTRRRKSQARVSLVSKIGRTLHRTPRRLA